MTAAERRAAALESAIERVMQDEPEDGRDIWDVAR